MNTAEYPNRAEIDNGLGQQIFRIDSAVPGIHLPSVIFPLIMSGFFRISAKAAIGIPQLATGPQKCVLHKNTHEIYILFAFV